MLFDDTYKTIAADAEGVCKEKNSKFISLAYPVVNEDEVKAHYLRIKKEHPKANHHCYAFRLGADKMAFRTNDDGEPANTAGKPILGQIQSNDLTDIVIFVVRYFGGTLLGVSGLINAYKIAAADAIANARVITKTVNEVYELTFRFADLNDMMKILKAEDIEITEQELDLDCRVIYSIRKTNADKIAHQLKKYPNIKLRYLRTT